MDDTAKPTDLAKQMLTKNKPIEDGLEVNGLASRIDKLEMMLAHLEDTVDKLNEVVSAQDKQISEQAFLIKKLAQKLEATQTDSGIAAFDVVADKPPHY